MNEWKTLLKCQWYLAWKELIGDTIYTIKYTLAKVKTIYNLMNNV